MRPRASGALRDAPTHAGPRPSPRAGCAGGSLPPSPAPPAAAGFAAEPGSNATGDASGRGGSPLPGVDVVEAGDAAHPLAEGADPRGAGARGRDLGIELLQRALGALGARRNGTPCARASPSACQEPRPRRRGGGRGGTCAGRADLDVEVAASGVERALDVGEAPVAQRAVRLEAVHRAVELAQLPPQRRHLRGQRPQPVHAHLHRVETLLQHRQPLPGRRHLLPHPRQPALQL